MKARMHTMVVTATFSRELEPKRARYFMERALADVHDLGKDHGRNPPMPIKLIKARVKNLVRVSASLKVKAKRKKLEELNGA